MQKCHHFDYSGKHDAVIKVSMMMTCNRGQKSPL